MESRTVVNAGSFIMHALLCHVAELVRIVAS